MNILIVDDHPSDRLLLRIPLEEAGHGVREVANGVEALRILRDGGVDAIVSDALMPHMDGFRLCMEIRQHAETAAVPFVMYTNMYNSESDRKLALDAGADAYMIKPAPVAALIEAIQLARESRAGGAASFPAEEMGLIKQYNSALIAKLEEKNRDLERALAEIRATEARFHGTLDRMLEGCQIFDHDWRYLYLNDAAAWHGQRKKEELIGRPLLECYPGFERSEVFTVMQRCMFMREGARVDNEFTYPDGTQAWFELSIQPVPEGIFILSLNITERKMAARKIRDQLDELLRWQEAMLDREARVQALKSEVNALLAEQQRPPRYTAA